MNLTSTWLAERLAAGDTQTQALHHLNTAAGTCTTHSRLGEWIHGHRSPDRHTRVVMLKQCLPPMLSRAGLDLEPDSYAELAESLA